MYSSPPVLSSEESNLPPSYQWVVADDGNYSTIPSTAITIKVSEVTPDSSHSPSSADSQQPLLQAHHDSNQTTTAGEGNYLTLAAACLKCYSVCIEAIEAIEETQGSDTVVYAETKLVASAVKPPPPSTDDPVKYADINKTKGIDVYKLVILSVSTPVYIHNVI